MNENVENIDLKIKFAKFNSALSWADKITDVCDESVIENRKEARFTRLQAFASDAMGSKAIR